MNSWLIDKFMICIWILHNSWLVSSDNTAHYSQQRNWLYLGWLWDKISTYLMTHALLGLHVDMSYSQYFHTEPIKESRTKQFFFSPDQFLFLFSTHWSSSEHRKPLLFSCRGMSERIPPCRGWQSMFLQSPVYISQKEF